MLQLRKLKKEIEEAKEGAEAAAERAEKEKHLQNHIAARLQAVEIEMNNMIRERSDR